MINLLQIFSFLIVIKTVRSALLRVNSTVDVGFVGEAFKKLILSEDDADLDLSSGSPIFDNIFSSAQVEGVDARKIEELIGATNKLSLLDGYGCWCKFTNYEKGRGQPKDFLDQQCKELYDRYTCAQLDLAVSEPDCVPHEITYNGPYLQQLLVSAISWKVRGNIGKALGRYKKMLSICTNENTSECAKKACQIEITFLYEIAPQIFMTIADDQQGYDAALDRSVFDFETECKTLLPNVQTQLSCCGQAPFQFQYNTLNTDVDCCNAASKLFNPVTHCCRGGRVLPCVV